MQNRVTVSIDGKSYTILASEDEAYIKKTAALVQSKISEIKKGASLSSIDSAMLTALNIADLYYKALAASDGLRAQMLSYTDENAALRAEIAKLKKRKGALYECSMRLGRNRSAPI